VQDPRSRFYDQASHRFSEEQSDFQSKRNCGLVFALANAATLTEIQG
jgi:hypothetical protein